MTFGDYDDETELEDDRETDEDGDDEDEDYEEGDGDNYDDDEEIFADPGGNSALRASSRTNPRNLPCPTCGRANQLTPKDKALGYQCDGCADRAEGRGGYGEY